MKILKLIFLVIVLVSTTLLIYGCDEKYTESDEINGLIKKNDLSINMKVGDDSDGFTVEKIYESDDYCLKIDVTDTYSLRGEAAIKPGNQYKLSFTLKNIDADPVINYSFWKKPVTSLRHYTFKGENGNPPSSETQELYDDWMTFEETFETREGEDSFLLTLRSGEGTFYIKEINIEHVK